MENGISEQWPARGLSFGDVGLMTEADRATDLSEI